MEPAAAWQPEPASVGEHRWHMSSAGSCVVMLLKMLRATQGLRNVCAQRLQSQAPSLLDHVAGCVTFGFRSESQQTAVLAQFYG
jgi:hypothetical protein